MNYSLTHLVDAALLRDLSDLVARDRSNTALLLAHIAEVDARKLYLPAAYSSMHAYCLGELRLSEYGAHKRIRAARAAREFPALFHAIADGRLHLCGVVLLASHLTSSNVDELIDAATHHSKAEIEQLLAERFPQLDVPSSLEPIASRPTVMEASPQLAPGPVSLSTTELAPPAPPARIAPIAPERFALQCTLPQATHAKLRYLQTLLSHTIPSGDIPAVLDQAFDAAIVQFEKRKFAATRHNRARRATRSRRHIPAHVRESVWRRDEGRCTFVGDSGRRCEARHRLEFDHVHEVARGGKATVDNLRLRCRAHNLYAAEQTSGAGFMAEKREMARRASAAVVAGQHAPAIEQSAQSAPPVALIDPALDVTPWLRQLKFTAEEARSGAAYCATLADASLEQRVRAAISYLRPKRPSHGIVRERAVTYAARPRRPFERRGRLPGRPPFRAGTSVLRSSSYFDAVATPFRYRVTPGPSRSASFAQFSLSSATSFIVFSMPGTLRSGAEKNSRALAMRSREQPAAW